MVENQRRCLVALKGLAGSYAGGIDCPFFHFAPIIRRTRLPRAEVRRQVRALTRAGLAEFARGLCTDDGDFAGSGYRITKAGVEALETFKAGISR